MVARRSVSVRPAALKSVRKTINRPSGTRFPSPCLPSAGGAGLFSCGPSGALTFLAPVMGSELYGDGLAAGGVGGFEELARGGVEPAADYVRGERLNLRLQVEPHAIVVTARVLDGIFGLAQ